MYSGGDYDIGNVNGIVAPLQNHTAGAENTNEKEIREIVRIAVLFLAAFVA